MIDESNPAGRLYKILSEAQRQPDNSYVKGVWAKVTAVEPNNIAVTKAVLELYSLSQEIQFLIKLNDELNHDLYLASFKKLEQVFFPLNLDSSWRGSKQHLTEEALTRLQFCAGELGRFYSEETLPPEELEDIVKKTDSLFETLLLSNLPDALRLALLGEVERIRSAISMYRIKGAKGLKEALQSTIGAMIANKEELESSSKNNTAVITRLGELIHKLDSFASRALKLKRAITRPIAFVLKKITDEESSNEAETEEA